MTLSSAHEGGFKTREPRDDIGQALGLAGK